MSHVPTHAQHGRVSFNAVPSEPVAAPAYEEGLKPHQYRQSYANTEGITIQTDYTTEYSAHHQPRATPHQPRPNYKPSALRLPFLCLLLLFVFSGMGLIAYALRNLPVEDPSGSNQRRGFERRAPQTSSVAVSSDSSSTTSADESRITVTQTRAESDFGQVGVSVTITSSPNGISSSSPTSSPPTDTSFITTLATRPESSFAEIGTSVSITSITVGQPAPSDHGDVGTVLITESVVPVTPTYVTAVVTTLTDSRGVPTYTATSTPSAFSTEQTMVLTNSLGQPTATQVTSVLATPVVTILTDRSGVPTATVTSYPIKPTPTAVVTAIYISNGQYFIGFFLPTLLSILMAIPIRILDLNAKLFQPWHELTHAHGATGRESLCRETRGWPSVVTSVRSLFGGQVLVFLTTILLICSALLVPLSAEAVTFRLQGSTGISCASGAMSGRGCAFVLSVFSRPARAALGLLAFMAVTLLFTVGVLIRWQTGVATNPWSIAGVAGLARSRELRHLFASVPSNARNPGRILKETLEDRRFELGWFSNDRGAPEYGIVLYDEGRLHPLHGDAARSPPLGAADEKNDQSHMYMGEGRKNQSLPFFMLGYAGRLLFLFVLCGTLAVILYYNNTGGDTPFEHFMSGESFGVRFLFTGVGVLITFLWTSFFGSKSDATPLLDIYTTAVGVSAITSGALLQVECFSLWAEN